MLEQWLKTLEDKEKGLLEELPKLSSDTRIIDLAQKEIRVNAQSCRNYLRRFSQESSFPLADDLSEEQKYYDNNKKQFDEREVEHYRILTNHIGSHLSKMEKVVDELKMGRFEPEFAQLY
ncbi:MAG: hypothetical protein AABX66_01015 [Nanoarchaeota archaeon]